MRRWLPPKQYVLASSLRHQWKSSAPNTRKGILLPRSYLTGCGRVGDRCKALDAAVRLIEPEINKLDDSVAFFTLANLMAVLVFAFAWTYGLDSYKLLLSICGSKKLQTDADFDTTLEPNTGQMNEISASEQTKTVGFRQRG